MNKKINLIIILLLLGNVFIAARDYSSLDIKAVDIKFKLTYKAKPFKTYSYTLEKNESDYFENILSESVIAEAVPLCVISEGEYIVFIKLGDGSSINLLVNNESVFYDTDEGEFYENDYILSFLRTESLINLLVANEQKESN